MTYPADLVQPPCIANWLVNLFAAGEEAEVLLGDMFEEFSCLAAKSGVSFARSWYWRQALKTVAYLTGNALRVAPWLIAATVMGGFLLNHLVAGLPPRAIFAALHRYQVFNHHFRAYVFFATDGIALGHVMTSLFVGTMVGLAAQRREMVATMALALVLCTMTVAAMLVWLATGQAIILWMLPWNVADWLAIVIGGMMVRMCRSVSTNLPSAA